MSPQSCESRINKELQLRMKELKQAIRSDKKRQEFEESILAITKTIVFKVELSWGGPADFFEVEVDPEEGHGIMNITYHYQEWFDGAQRQLEGEDLAIATQFFEFLTEF